jgi:hypothetical protein
MSLNKSEHSLMVYFYQAMKILKNDPDKRKNLILLALRPIPNWIPSLEFQAIIHRFDNLERPEEVATLADQIRLELL